jgi:MoxR-like ATPase
MALHSSADSTADSATEEDRPTRALGRQVEIDGVVLTLAHSDEVAMEWIGGQRLRDQLVASWLVIGPDDLPLNPRLIGKPGTGKTTLAYAVARQLGAEAYIYQCTMDTRPEDLLVTPVMAGDGKLAYHASSLVTAMLRGGACILDEANRMNEKSWASLAPLLDQRRYVESVIAGLKIHAHPNFRLCCTMNEDASTYEVPEYIQSRLQPQIEVVFPTRDEEAAILKMNVPLSGDHLLAMAVAYLQKAHRLNLRFTTRDGVHMLRYCLKMAALKKSDPRLFFDEAVEGVLGQDGLDFLHGIVPSGAHQSRMEDEPGLFRDGEKDDPREDEDDDDR